MMSVQVLLPTDHRGRAAVKAGVAWVKAGRWMVR